MSESPDVPPLVAAAIAQAAAANPSATALISLGDGESETERIRFGEIDARARAWALELRRAGLVGKPVLLPAPSDGRFVEALCGCLYAGAIAVPVPPKARGRGPDRRLAIAEHAQVAAAIGAGEAAGHDGILGRIPWLDLRRAGPSPAASGVPDLPSRHHPALLQYTSGSTGDPRGAVITHRNLAANLAMVRAAFGVGAESRLMTWLPLFHDMGIANILLALSSGIACVIMPPLMFLQRPRRWLQAIDRYRATISGAPNFAFDLCARKYAAEPFGAVDLRHWDVAFCAAEPVRPSTMQRFASAFAPAGFDAASLYPCYGMAEATVFISGGSRGGGVTVAAPGAARRAAPLAGCGRAPPGATILIVDPDSREPLPESRAGEVWVAGDHVAAGYWRDAAATAEVFGARLASGAGPFLRTGDLGFQQDGELYILGRRKTLIIHRGMNIFPEDVEATVAASDPAFGPIGAAFPVEIADEEQVVVAFELSPSRPPAFDPAGIIDRALDAIAEQHGLRLYDFVLLRPGALPRTTSGKAQRIRCRELYLAGELRLAPYDPRHRLLRRYAASQPPRREA